LEVAGEIEAVGERVSGWKPGDQVMALTNGGGYAEFVAVPAGQVLPVPQGWSCAEAASLPETWFTITQTLLMRAGLEPGMSVLVHGASGGIGGAAIQIAGIVGARSIGVVSSAQKADYACRLGAFATIDRTTEKLAERALELTGGSGVDRVVDVIGGDMAGENIRASARGGHILQISTLDGAKAPIDLRAIMAKQLTLSGSTLRPQHSEVKAAIAAHIRTNLLPTLEAPAFVRHQVTAFAMEEAAAAHREMESRNHLGKIVLLTPFGVHLG
jgi:NADPH2:quinone reductase